MSISFGPIATCRILFDGGIYMPRLRTLGDDFTIIVFSRPFCTLIFLVNNELNLSKEKA
jgi:hypothetical protein